MLRYFLFVCVVVLLSAPSWAQLYDGKHEEMVASMDRAANQVNDMWANVPEVAADQDALPQDARYRNMTEPVDQANERHFADGEKATTIVDNAKNDKD